MILLLWSFNSTINAWNEQYPRAYMMHFFTLSSLLLLLSAAEYGMWGDNRFLCVLCRILKIYCLMNDLHIRCSAYEMALFPLFFCSFRWVFCGFYIFKLVFQTTHDLMWLEVVRARTRPYKLYQMHVWCAMCALCAAKAALIGIAIYCSIASAMIILEQKCENKLFLFCLIAVNYSIVSNRTPFYYYNEATE